MKVVISRSSKKNREFIFDQIKEDLANKRQVYLMVPQQFTLSTELELFSYLKIDGMLNLKVKSFRSITEEVLFEQGGQSRPFLSDTSSILLLKIAIDQVYDQLETYKKQVNDAAFVELIYDFIKILKSNLVRPEDVIAMAKDDNNNIYKKLSDIYLIYKQYESLLNESGHDAHNKVDQVIDKLPHMDSYREVVFYVDQFSNMSKQEIEFIKAIDRISEITMTLTLDQRLLSYLSYQDVYEAGVDDGAIFDLSRRFLINLDPDHIQFLFPNTDHHSNPNIDYLLRHIFSYKIPDRLAQGQTLDNIYIQRYRNIVEEVEALAIEINKEIYLKKRRFKDIAVIVTNNQAYDDLISRQFDLNDIAYFLDSPRNLLANPMVKYIRASLDLLKSSFASADIVNYLKYAFFNIDHEKLNHFQNYLKERKIIGNMIFDPAYFANLEKQAEKEEHEDLLKNKAAILEVRAIFLDAISFFGQSFKDIQDFFQGEKSFQAHARSFYEFLSYEKALARYQEFESRIGENQSSKDLSIEDENRLIWNQMMQILDDFSLINPDLTVSFQDFTDYVNQAIDQMKVGVIPPSQDQVFVGNLDRSRFREVKKIFVLGMSNLYYPKSQQEASLFLEGEKQWLIDTGLELENTKIRYQEKDILSLYEALSKATEEIVFSYSLINESNQSMQRASLLDYVSPLIGHQQAVLETDYLDNIYAKTRLSHYLPVMYRRINRRRTVDKEEKNFVLTVYDLLKGKEDYQQIISAMDESNFPKRYHQLSRKSVDKIYSASRRFSVSQLENYYRCPYRHFIDYGLQPKEETIFNMDARAFGNIAHANADYFVKSHGKDNFKDEQAVQDVMADYFQSSVNDQLEDYQLADPRNRYYVRRLEAMLNVSLYILSKQLQLMHPNKSETEVRYGPGRELKPLEVTTKYGRHIFSGIIDRLDSYLINDKNYMRVIDYKTGNKQFDLAKTYHGLDLQLLIYLYTVVSQDEDNEPLGAYYLSLNHRYKSVGHNEIIDRLISDKHQLKGITLSDQTILEETDDTFLADERPNSSIIKVNGRYKNFYQQPHFLPRSSYTNLFDHVRLKVKTGIEGILDGDIAVYPYKLKNEIACTYCDYQAICRFEQNNYRHLDNYKDEQLLARLADDEQN